MKTFVIHLKNGSIIELQAAEVTPDPSGTLLFQSVRSKSTAAVLPLSEILICAEQGTFTFKEASQ